VHPGPAQPGSAQHEPGRPGAAHAGPAPQEAVRPVSDEDRVWVNLAAELTPAKSLERVDTATDRVVRTVTIIGTLLGGLGVFGATKPSVSGPARWLTIGGGGLRRARRGLCSRGPDPDHHPAPQPGEPGRGPGLVQAADRHAGLPTRAATFLLLTGAVLAGAAAIVALATATPDQATIAVTRALDNATATPGTGTGTGTGTTTITAEVTFPRADQRAERHRDGQPRPAPVRCWPAPRSRRPPTGTATRRSRSAGCPRPSRSPWWPGALPSSAGPPRPGVRPPRGHLRSGQPRVSQFR